MLGVTWGGLLWADVNAAAPPGALCPLHRYVNRKFWEEGNEHHTLADHPAAIVMHDEIVMGKDRKVGLVKEFEDVYVTISAPSLCMGAGKPTLCT